MMLKKTLAILLAAAMILALAACAVPAAEPAAKPAATESAALPADAEASPAEAAPEETAPAAMAQTLQIAALKGPTGMGLAKLMHDANPAYEITLYDAPDAVTGKVVSGEVDIAAVPVNLASVLYNKTQGQIAMIGVNTLGVLYVIDNIGAVQSLADLAGKTLYATGQGSTPQYVLEKLLSENGLSDSVTVEYVGEHAALAAMLASGEAELGMLPEPNVSAVLLKNENSSIALNLTDEWESAFGTQLVQGCYIVQKTLLDAHPEAVAAFLADAALSTDYMNVADDAAAIAAAQGVVGSEAIARKAIPNCNMVCICGDEMKTMTAAMLQALYDANPASIGGAMPDDAFYGEIG